MLHRRFLRPLVLAFSLVCCAVAARAEERIDEIRRMHLEALGGKARVEALSGLRASGQVLAGGKRLRFTMIAARPVKLRLETESAGRTLVQGYGGEGEPWEFDTGTWPPRYRSLAENSQKTFIADAEFDDPLVGGEKRGFTLEYVDEVSENGRALLRVRVRRQFTETYALLVDPTTYLIAWRVEERLSPDGKTTAVMTYYDDYRAVNGVLIAHRLSVAVGGVATQQTTVERIEANPAVTPDTFARPQARK